MFRLLLALSLFSTSIYAQSIERVISLSPSATEMAYAAGLGDKLVAVSEYSDYPQFAQKLEKVANHQSINIERVLTLQPDLVLAWESGNPAKDIAKLRQLGVNVVYSDANTLEGIANKIEELSQFADDPSIGKNNAAHFRQTLTQLKSTYQTQEPVSYFYQLSEKPIITVGQNNWPSEVFSFCGGRNVFADSRAPYPQVGLEQVIIANPEVIFTSRHAIENGSMWQPWSEQLQALQKEQVWTLNSDWINRPTQRTLLAIKQVCELFETVRQKR